MAQSPLVYNLEAMNTPTDKLEITFKQKWIDPLLRPFASQDMPRETLVHPCVIDEQPTLVYEKGLKENDPLAFQRVVAFADAQGYRVLEDRRSNFIEGIKRVKDARRANVISIMVLTTGLFTFSRNVLANPELDSTHDEPLANTAKQHESVRGAELDLQSYNNEQELVAGLLDWLNHHSAFTHQVKDMPKIITVSSEQMAKVAFGDELPKAVNPKSLNIYGLYNFNEKAVYILDTLDLRTDKGKSILLHELVHFLQYQYGQDKDVACKNELEALAYLLEAKYLQAHDHKPSFNLKQVKRISQCT